jgi:DNA invertase Pin-like site-specific DNA recombinase
MIAGAYLRKSTDEGDKAQDAKSNTRQLEHARQYGAKQGWTLDDHFIYADDGVSGAEFERRPGLQKLLAALAPRPPFQVLIVSEVSRLGRDTVSTLLVIKRLRDAGVRIVSYLDGRDVTLDDEQGELNAFLQSMLASGERRKRRSARPTSTASRRTPAMSPAAGPSATTTAAPTATWTGS